MKNMNKIYGLNIDALRLCYEVTEPNNINVIKDKEIGEEIDFLYFYLRRIEGKHFKFVYEIRYNDMGKDKLFGELRLGMLWSSYRNCTGKRTSIWRSSWSRSRLLSFTGRSSPWVALSGRAVLRMRRATESR